MPLANILEAELFEVCNIYFMAHFPQLFGNIYLVVVDYVSKGIKVVASLANDAKVVKDFNQICFDKILHTMGSY